MQNANPSIVREMKNLEIEINKTLHSEHINFNFFEESHIILNHRESNELNFLYYTVYLYGLFIELSRVNFDYIIEKMKSMSIGDYKNAMKQKKIVNDLRTLHFHNLSPKKQSSIRTIKACNMWFLRTCNKFIPENEHDWTLCVEILLSDSIKVLKDVKTCLNEIASDDDKNSIFKEWELTKSRDIPDFEIENIVTEASKLYALNVDTHKFTKIHNDKIKRHLSTLSFSNLNLIKNEILLYVEKIFFEVNGIPCPVSGLDIKQEFEVNGKELGELKQKAIKIFYNDLYMTKEQILNELRT